MTPNFLMREWRFRKVKSDPEVAVLVSGLSTEGRAYIQQGFPTPVSSVHVCSVLI